MEKMIMNNFFAIIIVLFASGCPINTLQKKEVEMMKAEYMLRYGKEPDLWPVIVGMKDDYMEIFSVPVENAVGTNVLNNAITLLRFKDDEILYDEISRDFIGGVGLGDKCYPEIFSDSWIGYTQTRAFLLFNLEDKSFARNILVQSGSAVFTRISVFDASKFQFVFQLKHLDSDSEDGTRYIDIIEFDCRGGYKEISRLHAGVEGIGYVEPWAVQNKTIFVYNNDSIKITAYDINFNPVQHPFCDLFNNLEDFRCLDQLVIHPFLPMAVLVEMDREARRKYKVYLAFWESSDPEKRFIELLGQQISMFSDWSNLKGLFVSDFQFSPDGKWLVFRDDSEKVLQRIENPTFIAMPVDGSREMPLGKPKVLGKVTRENASPSSTAWITKPLSFVVCDDKVLYKWELDKLKREFKEEK